jgi:uncharacterized protein YukE
MPGDLIVMKKPMMREMKAEFQKVAEELDAALQEALGFAQQIDDGALIGDGGSLLAETLRTAMKNKLTELRDKAEEMQRELQRAMDNFDDTDQSAASSIYAAPNR